MRNQAFASVHDLLITECNLFAYLIKAGFLEGAPWRGVHLRVDGRDAPTSLGLHHLEVESRRELEVCKERTRVFLQV